MEWIKRDLCPVCGGPYRSFDTCDHEGKALNYDRCIRCSLVFMNPVPDQASYHEYYAHQFWEGKAKDGGVASNRGKILKQTRWARKLSRFVGKNLPAGESVERILEVGCAFGAIVRLLADELGAKPFGVEPSTALAGLAGEKGGVDLLAENVEALAALDPEEPMDMILNSHVLENIVDLGFVMETYRKTLRDGGWFLIDTPNVFIQRSLGFVHPYVFCETSIRTLLALSGFKVVALGKSGRGKSVLLPRYITVLARKEPVSGDVALPGGDGLFSLKADLGFRLERILASGPFGRLDASVDARLNGPTPAALALMEKYLN